MSSDSEWANVLRHAKPKLINLTAENADRIEFHEWGRFNNHADVVEMADTVIDMMRYEQSAARILRAATDRHSGAPTPTKVLTESREMVHEMMTGPLVWCDTDTTRTIEELAKTVPLPDMSTLCLPGHSGTVLFQSSVTEDLTPIPVDLTSKERPPAQFFALSWQVTNTDRGMALIVMPWVNASWDDTLPVLGASSICMADPTLGNEYIDGWEFEQEEDVPVWRSPHLFACRVIAALSAYCAGVVEVTDEPLPRPVRRRSKAKGAGQSRVSVIRMRKAQRTTGDDTDSGKPATKRGPIKGKRWTVRGHWRQQACGPARSQRRTIWVSPYVKGEAGAPITQVQKLWKVDR